MKTILLADDEKNIREFCKQELEDEGYRLILARDGREAIKLVRKEQPDLVILDLCMPRLGGLDAIEPIWAIAPEVPIILFTANDEYCVSGRPQPARGGLRGKVRGPHRIEAGNRSGHGRTRSE